jgi:hypothetical protein
LIAPIANARSETHLFENTAPGPAGDERGNLFLPAAARARPPNPVLLRSKMRATP